MDQEAADREAERLQAAGTRATTSVDADVPFRERFVQMMCQCGIPLTRAVRCASGSRVNARSLSLLRNI